MAWRGGGGGGAPGGPRPPGTNQGLPDPRPGAPSHVGTEPVRAVFTKRSVKGTVQVPPEAHAGGEPEVGFPETWTRCCLSRGARLEPTPTPEARWAQLWGGPVRPRVLSLLTQRLHPAGQGQRLGSEGRPHKSPLRQQARSTDPRSSSPPPFPPPSAPTTPLGLPSQLDEPLARRGLSSR